jgi:DNA modification methylase
MDVTYQPIQGVIPYEFNARTHDETQVNRIANSIKEFGFNQPIVIDEQNIVIVGHGRLLAAKKLGLSEVPVLKKAGLSEAQKKAYRILDNKLQNDSSWSFDNLELDLGFMEDNGIDLEAWGLDELRDLLQPEAEAHEDNFDAAACENEECLIKRGDVIELGRHRLMCGDSTDSAALDEVFTGKLCHLVVTDPPYGVSYDGGTTERERLAGDDTTELYPPTCLNAFKYSDEHAPLYLFHAGVKGYAAAAAAAAAGYEIRCELVWNKNQAQFGALSAQYKQKHEPFYYCYKHGKTARWFGPTNEVTVWDCPRASVNEWHPTQKPIELIARAIGNSSELGNIVADFFLGSGSTLIACEQLGRTCYGMEIEPKYCHVIIERYRKHCADAGKDFECKVNGDPYP